MYKENVFFLKNGFHKKISSYESFILDSNIVIKFRDLFYNPHKMNNEEVAYYIGLLEFFKEKDVVPGIAIQELSWDFERFETDTIKETRLVNAMNSLFSYDESTISRIKAQLEYSSETKPLKQGKRNFNSLYLNSEGNMFLLPSFCVMLKYHQVLRLYSDKHIRYIEICNFLMNTLKLVGAYELSLISELLFCPDKSKTSAINSMLKLDTESNVLKGIWNSCWDIFFLRFITGFAANTLNNKPSQQIFNPILVTRDENLKNVGSELENSTEVVVGNQIYPGITGGYEYSQEDANLVNEMSQKLIQTSTDRVKEFNGITGEKQIEHFLGIIKNLESKLLKLIQ